MPTKLTKAIRRELLGTPRGGGRWIIELEPGDTLTFRMKGRKTRYEVSAWSALNLAILQHIQGAYLAKQKAYKDGRRTRKPKAPSVGHFDTKLRLALRG